VVTKLQLLIVGVDGELEYSVEEILDEKLALG
jgi:hypothetical protein